MITLFESRIHCSLLVLTCPQMEPRFKVSDLLEMLSGRRLGVRACQMGREGMVHGALYNKTDKR